MSEVISKLVVDLSLPEGHPDRVQSIPLTAEELAEREEQRILAEAEQAKREAEEAKREADKLAGIETLKGLGLTDDQIAALLS